MSSTGDIRRVVTTHDASGKAVVLFDGMSPHKMVREAVQVVSRALWQTTETPADMAGPADRGAAVRGITPPAGGSVFRIVDFGPSPDPKTLDPAHMAHEVGGQSEAPGRTRYRPPSHPLMHRTRSVDYAIILAGEIDMLLDDSELHLKAGDVVIQQGTNHAWVNRGSETCRIAFVLIDAKEA